MKTPFLCGGNDGFRLKQKPIQEMRLVIRNHGKLTLIGKDRKADESFTYPRIQLKTIMDNI